MNTIQNELAPNTIYWGTRIVNGSSQIAVAGFSSRADLPPDGRSICGGFPNLSLALTYARQRFGHEFDSVELKKGMINDRAPFQYEDLPFFPIKLE
jgi:hypothetical protein